MKKSSKMTMLTILMVALAFPGGVVMGWNKTTAALRRVSSNDDQAVLALRKLGELDEQVVERYNLVPKGYRKHPSYYSEKYLTRARRYTDEQKSELTSKWKRWEFIDTKASTRPSNDFYESFPNRDVPRDQFPQDTAWQKDNDYLSKFLPDAIALVKRAMEAILAEYGLGKDDDNMQGKDFEERSTAFQPSFDLNKPAGGGSMPKESFEGLKRRILHAIMTEDRFTIAMGGHSAAAGTSFLSLPTTLFYILIFFCFILYRSRKSFPTDVYNAMSAYFGTNLCSSGSQDVWAQFWHGWVGHFAQWRGSWRHLW